MAKFFGSSPYSTPSIPDRVDVNRLFNDNFHLASENNLLKSQINRLEGENQMLIQMLKKYEQLDEQVKKIIQANILK